MTTKMGICVEEAARNLRYLGGAPRGNSDRVAMLEMLKTANIPHLLEDGGDVTIDAPGKRYVAFEFGADGSLKRVGVWSD